MSDPYQELLAGETFLRNGPGERHETICERLHATVRASVSNFTSTRLLRPRTRLEVAANTIVCPDLALITTATHRLWLAAEIVDSQDHKPDTVFKKQVYEEIHLPRLWIIDPRYNNVEVYHSTPYGLSLKEILAGRDLLADKLLPEFEISINALFAED